MMVLAFMACSLSCHVDAGRNFRDCVHIFGSDQHQLFHVLIDARDSHSILVGDADADDKPDQSGQRVRPDNADDRYHGRDGPLVK
jgi:hypothetical protein